VTGCLSVPVACLTFLLKYGSLLLPLAPLHLDSSIPRLKSPTHSLTWPHPSAGDHHPKPPFMQGIKRLKEAVQKHRENKDINIKYKTPLTGKSEPSPHPHTVS
jgi:hypothetical protein